MDFSSALLMQIDYELEGEASTRDLQSEFLEWIAGASFLKLSVHESELELRKKYFRFTVEGKDESGVLHLGFGRSANKKTAATIGAMEMLERFVSRSVLKQGKTLAPLKVRAEDGGIDVEISKSSASFPSSGFHSSNGWAVHFSPQEAIERAMREALERHILLLSYLKNGWSGFLFDEVVPFKDARLHPGVASVSAGGFSAGIVVTEGSAASGTTFGYLCASGDEFQSSERWMGAFLEGYEQWVDLTTKPILGQPSFVEQYQRHFLNGPAFVLPANNSCEEDYSAVSGNLAVFDLRKLFECPFPLYAASVFGGDLIPLFFRQKLTADEGKVLAEVLGKYGIGGDLPEYHPIL
jgi:hypothetical protein